MHQATAPTTGLRGYNKTAFPFDVLQQTTIPQFQSSLIWGSRPPLAFSY
jgi:hypothetical protein